MSITAANLMVRVQADTAPAEHGLQSFQRNMAGAARNLGGIGAGMSLAITAPLVGIAAQGLKAAAGFEKSFNVLETVTRAPAKALADLQAQALELGATTIFSAGQAAEGMLELAKAGFSTEQITASIPGVMALAAAGEMDLANAANLTTAALNAFGLEASDSGRIADLLAAGANASNASIADLGAGLQQGAFMFNATGQTVDDLVASLALLANEGLSGSDAGTALKNMFTRLINPTQEAADAMAELGIDVFDASGNMLPLVDIIGVFNEALDGMTMEQKDAALSTILMGDGMKALLPLLDAGTDGYKDMLKSVREVGAATKISNALTKGLGGAMEYLTGSIESFLIGAGLPFLEFVGDILRGVADAITAFGELPEPIRNAALAFAAVLAAAGPIIGVIAAVAGAFALVGTAVVPVMAVTAAIAGLAALVAADVGGIQGILATAGTAIADKFTAITTAVSALITEFGLWRQMIDTEGIASDTFLLAAEELDEPWKSLAKALSASMAAFELLMAAFKGTVDLRRFLQLNEIISQVFGTDTATKITNVALAFAEFGKDMRGVGAAIGLFVGALKGDLDLGQILKINETLSAAFGPTVTERIMNAAVGVANFAAEIRKLDAKQLLATGAAFAQLMTANLKTGIGKIDVAAIRGEIVARLGLDNLKIDIGEKGLNLSGMVTNLRQKIEGLQTEITNAFEAEGWAGLGALAQEKIAGIGTAIGVGLASMGNAIMNALAVAALLTRMEINSLLSGGGLTFIDEAAVGRWIGDQVAALRAQFDQWFGTGNIASRTIDRMVGMVETIRAQLTGFGDMALLDKFGTAVGALITAMQTVSTIQWDVIGTAGPLLTGFATDIVNFANTLLNAIDPQTIQTSLTNFTKNVGGAIGKMFSPEEMGDLGTALGKVTGTIVSKLTELLSGEKFAADMGTAVGTAAGTLTASAAIFGAKFADEVAKTDPMKLVAAADTFASTFITELFAAFFRQIKDMTIFGDWGDQMKAKLFGPDALQQWGKQIANEWTFGMAFPEDAIDLKVNPIIDDQAFVNRDPLVIPVQPNWVRITPEGVGEPAVYITPKVSGPDVEQMGPLPKIDVTANVIKAEPAMNLQMDFWEKGPKFDVPAEPLQMSAPVFEWPVLPIWTWPPYNPFEWPLIGQPDWVWLPIPRPGWLNEMNVPRPSWLGELLTWEPIITVRQQAQTTPGQITGTGLAGGTPFWRGGLTWVGEQGPEIVRLPAGSAVYDAQTSARMAQPSVVIENVHIHNDMDIHETAAKLVREIERRGRR